MGSPNGELGGYSGEVQHNVTLTQKYYLQTTEVTQGQWKAVMGINPSYFGSCGDDCPVERVSWEDAQEFIEKLNLHENTNCYRLPTEAQWEYAASGRTICKCFKAKICRVESQIFWSGGFGL
jgi:formylglycine-generating enzyme required for sulfatase activity